MPGQSSAIPASPDAAPATPSELTATATRIRRLQIGAIVRGHVNFAQGTRAPDQCFDYTHSATHLRNARIFHSLLTELMVDYSVRSAGYGLFEVRNALRAYFKTKRDDHNRDDEARQQLRDRARLYYRWMHDLPLVSDDEAEAESEA
ncbi:hypothetical protein GGI12_005982 [Dipsacomyces acuminosporus]|nr:hypothetical protein GGI12_005982 [Dipsacomyces acuminosporus]